VKVAEELLDKEILFQADLERLIGKRPFDKETNYQAYMNKKEEGKVDEKVDESKKKVKDSTHVNGKADSIKEESVKDKE
jgi:cell division protease FtsH